MTVGNRGNEELSVMIPETGGEAAVPDARSTPRLSLDDIKHNMKFVVMLDAIYAMGATDMQIAAQPLWKYLRATNTQIGLIGSLAMISLIGNFLAPFISRKCTVKKWYLLISHIPYIGTWGLIGLTLMLSNRLGLSIPALLSAVMALNAANFFFAGFVSLPQQEYTAACIPMSHRGRLNGYASSIGSGLAMISSAIGLLILLRVAKPMSFGWLFVMAWIICQSGYLLAMFGREIPTPVEKSPPTWSKEMLMAAWNDKPFVGALMLFVLYTIVFQSSLSVYVSQYGLRELGMIDASAATIALLMQIVRITLGGPVGHLVDRISAKRVVQILPLFGCLTILPVVCVRSQYAVYVTMGMSALFFTALWASFFSLLYGIPSPENRSGHYSVQIIISNIAAAIGPVITGGACDLFSYKTTFVLVFACSLGLAWLARRILFPLSVNAADYA